MIAALAFGGTLFWVLMAAFIVIEVVSVFCENGPLSTAMMVIMIITLQLSGVDLIGNSIHHPLYTMGIIGGYVIVGTVWMVCKWWFFTNKFSREVDSGFVEWKKTAPAGAGQFSNFCKTTEYHDILRKIGIFSVLLNPQEVLSPARAENYRRLIYWVSYWPLSFVLTMINDPIVRLMKFVVERCGGLLSRISTRALGNIGN